LDHYELAAGRWIILRERKGLFGLVAEAKVMDHPVDVLTVLLEPGLAEGVSETIVQSGKLTDPGRGSVFSEEVVVLRSHELCRPAVAGPRGSGDVKMQRDVMGICCIVQRGEGDRVARVALDTGTCVPAIQYGHGTGVRDKLGLLRITVPAEKEVVHLIVSSHDADPLMNLLIDVGRLDEPGKGFVYLFPLGAAQVNTKVIQGMPRHAASMEQIIGAIDDLKEGSGWRARGGSVGMARLKRDRYLLDLVSLTLACDEGRGEPLVRAAIRAGVPGATMTRTRFVCPPDSLSSSVSPAREVCTMVVARSLVGPVVTLMEEQGALDDETHGQICAIPVPKAYTFIGRN
jgi:nitrogen regulatory protein PII